MALTGIARVSNSLMSNLLLGSLRDVQVRYAHVQQQMATGDKLLSPSDDAPAASQIMSLDRTMQLNAQITANLNATASLFDMTDDALGKAGDLLTDCRSLVLNAIGLTADEQKSKAGVLNSNIESIMEAANTRLGGIFIFGGDASSTVPFASDPDGIRYDGAFLARQGDLGGVGATDLGLLGVDAFGMDAVTVAGANDLSPAMTADTRLADLNGALGEGIRLDTIRITDSVGTDVRVDLTGCDRVSDVVDTINQACGGAVVCSVRPDGQGLQLDAALPGADLRVYEGSVGHVARDLGLYSPTGSGATVVGGDVEPRMTATTKLSQLGALDLSSGLAITNGGKSDVINFDLDTTVGDMLNRLNHSDLGIRASINANGDGIDITNLVCGSDLHIGENGGTTAADLGLRSLGTSTKLSDFRDGRGVRISDTGPDLLIRLSDGTTELEVDLDGAITVGDVIDRINAASAAAGLTLTASEKTVGNGIELTDSAGAAQSIYVASINSSSAAEDLGIAGFGQGDTLTGTDTFDRRTGGVFDTLIRLRDAMMAGDEAEMTFLGEKLETVDQPEMVSARSRMGGLVQDLTNRLDRNTDIDYDNQELRSILADTDFYEAYTRYTQLQTALQANLMTSGTLLSTSLLNYLQ